MSIRHLMVGASALAFAATAASAQNNVVDVYSQSSASPNNNDSWCFQQAGTYGNNCKIRQNGTLNEAEVVQNGNLNSSYIEQQKADGGPVYGTIVANADDSYRNNEAEHRQDGNSNVATTIQRSDGDNVSKIYQVALTANSNQAGNAAAATQSVGDSNVSFVQQYGNGQSATVTQAGFGNDNTIIQGGGLDDTSVNRSDPLIRLNSDSFGGVNNTVTVSQMGTNLYSSVDQSSSSSQSLVQNNQATVQEFNNLSGGSALEGNSGTITQASNSNTATVYLANGDAVGPQGGTAFNTAIINQSAGSNTGPNNQAYIGIGNANNATLASENNSATVTQNSTLGKNLAEIAITGGISGNDPGQTTVNGPGADTKGLSGGNTAAVNQGGAGNYSTAVVTISVDAKGQHPYQALGNNVTVTQNPTVAFSGTTTPAASQGSAAVPSPSGSATKNDRIAVSEPVGTTQQPFAEAINAAGQFAATWSLGRYGNITVNQNSGVDSGTIYRDSKGNVTGVARARASLYQGGELNTTTVNQTGDNYANVTQGRVGTTNQPDDRKNTVSLLQIDAGDGGGQVTSTTTTTAYDQYGNPYITNTPNFGPAVRQYNQAIITQYGLSNSVQGQGATNNDPNNSATQNGENAFLTIFQGTDASGTKAVAPGQTQANNLQIRVTQGNGDSAALAGTNGYTGNANTPAGYQAPLVATSNGPNGAFGDGSGMNAGVNSVGATANFTQGGSYNLSSVEQDASNSVINITQLGNGGMGGYALDQSQGNACGAVVCGNNITIVQQGNNNRATGVQGAGVGPSASTDPASGYNAQQNVVYQNNANATADQYYFGGGTRSAEILILQGGLNNNARAEQQGRGQFARIEQAGSGNSAGILQEASASNATAVIRQWGSGNSFYIDQNQPGQYALVEQSGMNNTATNQLYHVGTQPQGSFAQPTGFAGF